MKFDLSDVLAGAAALDTGAETSGRDVLKYIDIDELHADERNFYSLEGIDQLAANIATLGLQQPLRIRPADDGDGYTIVSGHRRCAALRMLHEAGEHDGKIPCILDQGGASPELQELRLIYANSDTRRMTSYDISRQANRVEELLYKLQEQGMEFPGRMRDHVAEACKVSRTKLARLKAIDNNLAPELQEYYRDGRLNESAAYELSQQEPAQQIFLFNVITNNGKRFYNVGTYVATMVQAEAEIDSIECPENHGAPCTCHAPKLAARMDYKYNCTRKCCRDCPDLATCKHSCMLCSSYKDDAKAAKKEASDKAAAARKAAEQPDIDLINGIYERMNEVMTTMDVTSEQVAQALAMYPLDAKTRELRAKALDKGLSDGITSLRDDLPFGYVLSLDDIKALIRLKKLLGCGIDYLLGGSHEP